MAHAFCHPAVAGERNAGLGFHDAVEWPAISIGELTAHPCALPALIILNHDHCKRNVGIDPLQRFQQARKASRAPARADRNR
jgi:hypothetical protein